MRRENPGRPAEKDEDDSRPVVVIEATVEAAAVLARDLYRAAVELGPTFGMQGAPIAWDRMPAMRRGHLEAVALAVLRKRAMDADHARPHRPGRPKAPRVATGVVGA